MAIAVVVENDFSLNYLLTLSLVTLSQVVERWW